MNLNETALQRCQQFFQKSAELRVEISHERGMARVIDCGVNVDGGLEAGVALTEVCMAGLGQVCLVPARADLWAGPAIQVSTDYPVAACMASQYAGWQIAAEGYFAMGSGPMRAVRGREELFDSVGYRERASHVVGVLESGALPPAEVCSQIAEECGTVPAELTLLVAPTASVAGTAQVVGRTVETCLHKMHELGFDLLCVKSGFGVAPLPPVAADDLVGIGRTNDAVLYGGEVTLWVRAEDGLIEERGPKIPSSSSPDYGRPFLDVFEQYDRDFYKIDPLLFSPACVTLVNLDTGRAFRFGEVRPEVIGRSFSG
jgi:methenyltetrahydromethanopterin cyclohydrolase